MDTRNLFIHGDKVTASIPDDHVFEVEYSNDCRDQVKITTWVPAEDLTLIEERE